MNSPTAIEDYVHKFAEFLTCSREAAQKFFSGHSEAINDWIQASWELLVEAQLERGVALYPYNGGADCYETSSRVYLPDSEPTHAVVCFARSRSGSAIDALTGSPIAFSDSGFLLQELVTMSDGLYMPAPPYDHVRVGDHVKRHIFKITDVRLDLRPMTETRD